MSLHLLLERERVVYILSGGRDMLEREEGGRGGIGIILCFTLYFEIFNTVYNHI